MAKGGRGGNLSRSLRSFLRKWKSSTSRSSSSDLITSSSSSSSGRSTTITTTDEAEDSLSLHPVYVGKSRRRYLISSQVVDHPLFQELADKSSDGLTVGCEVVLFEHLLWMLENANDEDPVLSQWQHLQHPDSLQDLVHFYTCC